MSKSELIIALDAMGGDHGPAAVIPGAAKALSENPRLKFLLFGDENLIQQVLQKHKNLQAVSEIRHTPEKISDDERPSVALRKGRNSSMRLAINAVADNQAQGIVSSGNTGALMAMAKMGLKMLPEIHRPAIASVFPTERGYTVVLDLGANINVDSENLAQFAVLGAVYSRLQYNIENPIVGLLNVGSEDVKGPDSVRGASGILSQVKFPGSYYGFVEGDDILKGKVDVVVTDGFTGNISLKMAEGVAAFITSNLRTAFNSGIMARIGYLFARSSLRKMRRRLDPRLYNGGIFMGLNGICLKSHGGSDDIAFSHAVLRAAELIEGDFNQRAVNEIEKLISQDSFFDQNGGEMR